MEENSAIASLIERTEYEKAYDYYCKKILSNKQILAHIMKGCVREYKDAPLKEIPVYIESVSRGEGMPHDRIEGRNSEDESIAGALIKYDILFEAALPHGQEADKKETISLFINIEAQNKDNPGYPLVSRALYYCSRLVAKQKNAPEGFQRSEFGKMKKVYSIWICIQHAREKNDVINVYAINEHCLRKRWRAPKEQYDLMSMVMIYPDGSTQRAKPTRGERVKRDDADNLLEMLDILFSVELSAKDKKSQLSEKCGILMTQDIEKEMSAMCNLSQGIKEAGINEGIAKGLAEGLAEGLTKGKKEGLAEGLAEGAINTTARYVMKLMQIDNIDAKQAMDFLEVDVAIRPNVLQKLQQQDNKK